MPELPPGVSVGFPDHADAALHAEVHRVLLAVVELGGAVGWTHVPSEDETAEWLERELAPVTAGRGGVAVVRRDGRLEALGVWSAFTSQVLAQNAEIRRVMVAPDARGQGLARVVMAALEDHAREHGVEVVLLDARGNNHAAQALYDALGWIEYGRIPDFVGVGDERWDRVCYYKRLVTPDGVMLLGSNAIGAGASNRR